MNGLLTFKSHTVQINYVILHVWRVGMFILLLLLSSLYALSQSSTAPTPKIVTQYDRFKDKTTVGVSTMLENYTVEIPFAHMQEFLLLLAGFTYKGQHFVTSPTIVRIAFQSQARTWRFGEGAELLGIIDGTRVDFGQLSYARKDLGAGHLETMRLDVPVHIFLKLARAKSAELRVGSKEVKLGMPQLATLATLADHLIDAVPARSTPTKRTAQTAPDPSADYTSHPMLQPTDQAVSSLASQAAIYNCPLHLAQLQPLRGFKLGMTLSDALEQFHGTPTPVSRPNELGVRALRIALSRSQNEGGVTRLESLNLKFIDEHLYRIEATYAIGKEWEGRPMSEFASTLSRGLGVSSIWDIAPDTQFKLDCGEVNFNLEVDDESLAGMPSRQGMPVAVAYLTLTDTVRAAQILARRDSLRQRDRRRDAERRGAFKP